MQGFYHRLAVSNPTIFESGLSALQKESTMIREMKISVRRVCPLTDEEDAGVAGTYLVTFDPKAHSLPLPTLAGIALDVFHMGVMIGTLDDFEIYTVGHDNQIIKRADDYEEYSGDLLGTLDKVGDVPQYLPALDAGATADSLEDRYNPNGDGEHPIHTRDAWILAVQQKVTLRGYWDWAAAQIEEALSASESAAASKRDRHA